MDSSLVYLVQTDTTVGFSSSNDEKLSFIKQRATTQKILQTVDSFKTLKQNTRIPSKFKRMIRNSKLSTFIYPNGNSYRVVAKNNAFHSFIKKFSQSYSTSANLSKEAYDEKFAYDNADIIVVQKDGFSELKSSSIYRLNTRRIKKLR
ncbi:MAG: Sua5 YciO YrdC YwlC family protein [Arcobacter sp.]|nr:MAG: Sua5 YciO YrdC YwlC family protein [Arcobacter sp.]